MRGFTLIEMLVIIAVLGLSAALIVPSLGSTGVLRVQAAVRTIVSDITFVQFDAVAFQEKRAIVFDVPASSYRLVQVPGAAIDAANNTMYDPTNPTGLYTVDFRDQRFGGARIVDAVFDGTDALIFDALGGPIADASGNAPGTGGTITVTGSGQTFVIRIEAFTGRATVEKGATP